MVIVSQELVSFIRAAMECSIFVAPLEPGLTHDEVMEVCKRAGFQSGEINDALPQVTTQYFGGGRLQADLEYFSHLQIFSWREDPEFRNFKAVDFVFEEFNKLIKSEGATHAKLERSVLVERAASQGIGRHDVQVAITILLLTKQLEEKSNLLWRPHGGTYSPLPSEQQRNPGAPMKRPQRSRAFPLVKDVIERRTDGRPKHAEPFDAFADALTSLGYEPFRLWWKQTASELNRSDAASFPVSICVLSAALVEGALAFVVKHARALGLEVLASKSFDEAPRTWKIDDLVNSAARGRDSAILNDLVRARANRLILLRQRIHAGRMLSDFPSGPTDLRPEEARESRETAEIIVRAILDWLNRYPAVTT